MAKISQKQPKFVEFFKVFLSDLSSHELSFPPAFVTRLKKKMPRNVTLKDHIGKYWDVQLIKTEQDMIIKEGWKRFANHHALVDGDFLLFKYDMNSEFFVKVFCKNGLKKKNDLSEKEPIIFKDVKEEPGIELKEENGRNKSSSSGCKRKYSEMESEKPRRPVGRPKGSTKAKMKQNQSSSPGSNTKLNQISSAESKSSGSKRGRPRKIKETPYPNPKNPYFESIMNQSSQYSLYVQKSELTKHNFELKENIKLQDENGKLWPVKLRFRTDGRIVMNNGWHSFYIDRKLSLRDRCIFEFMPSEDNIVKVIQVYIVRKTAGTKDEPETVELD